MYVMHDSDMEKKTVEIYQLKNISIFTNYKLLNTNSVADLEGAQQAPPPPS